VEAAETKREGKPGKATAQELVGVTWYALLARQFTKALTDAERAHALLPDDLVIETNRAHALMSWNAEKKRRRSTLPIRASPFQGKIISFGNASSTRTSPNSARRA
jgi:hypothetical protein